MDEMETLLYLTGTGHFCINTKANDNDSDRVIFDIVINKNRYNMPVRLSVSHGFLDTTKFEIIRNNGLSISKMKLREETKEFLKFEETRVNDLNKDTSAENKSAALTTVGNEINDKTKETKTHKRNNSDFLDIFGRGNQNISTSIEDNWKVSEAIGEQHGKARTPVEHSTLFSECSKDSQLYHSGILCGNTIDQEQCSDRSDSEDIVEHKIINIPVRESSGGCDNLPRMQKMEKECLERDVSFPRSLPGIIMKTSQNLQDAIRKSYTYLLDVLEPLDLCDHLYEKYLLDIKMYQQLFEMCYIPGQLRNAKRSLLMHLSTRNVPKDKFIAALNGSAQYKLISRFYPGIRM